jgi:hypothetical protein
MPAPVSRCTQAWEKPVEIGRGLLLREIHIVPIQHAGVEEVFGPVISAMPFVRIEEGVRRGNDTQYGLGSGIWTRDINTAHKVSKGLRAGTVWINCYRAMDAAVPFGDTSGPAEPVPRYPWHWAAPVSWGVGRAGRGGATDME